MGESLAKIWETFERLHESLATTDGPSPWVLNSAQQLYQKLLQLGLTDPGVTCWAGGYAAYQFGLEETSALTQFQIRSHCQSPSQKMHHTTDVVAAALSIHCGNLVRGEEVQLQLEAPRRCIRSLPSISDCTCALERPSSMPAKPSVPALTSLPVKLLIFQGNGAYMIVGTMGWRRGKTIFRNELEEDEPNTDTVEKSRRTSYLEN